MDAILYVVRRGCSWPQLPVDFPPWQTVYWYFVRWEGQQVTEQSLDRLRKRVRTAQGRNEQPSAGIIDSVITGSMPPASNEPRRRAE